MTNPALMKMLEKYDLTNSQSSHEALREVLQEIVLLGLSLLLPSSSMVALSVYYQNDL